MHNSANKYIEYLESCFYFQNELLIRNISLATKKPLTKGILEKDSYSEKWGLFINEVGSLDNIVLRDITKGGYLHSFNAQARLRTVDKKGVHFSLNFPSKLFGCYYWNFLDIGPDKYQLISHYETQDNLLLSLKNGVFEIFKKYIIGIHEFDHKYAELKISDIYIEDILYSEIELWQILFTNNKTPVI